MQYKQNKKLILGILLTFIICIGSAIFAAYSTGPYGAYPNPGIHPGMVGPGTFNASGVVNPQWNFLGDLGVFGILDMNNNKIINISTPTANSDVATKGYVDAAGGDSGWDKNDFSLIGAVTFTAIGTGTKIIGTFTESELVCNFGNSSNPTIFLKASPPQSNPTGYQVVTSNGVSNTFLVKTVNPSATEDLLIWSVSGIGCNSFGPGKYWKYDLYLKGDGTLSLEKSCDSTFVMANGYTDFICYER